VADETTYIPQDAIHVTEVTKFITPNPVSHYLEGEHHLWDIILNSDVSNDSAVAFVNDEKIERDRWRYIICEPGDRVMVRPVPQDSDTAKIVQFIVTMIAMIAMPFLAPGIAAAVAVGAAALNVGLSVIFAPPSVNLGDPGKISNIATLTGARNALNQWGPIPVVIGKEFRVFPQLAAKPHTEVRGGEQFMRLIFEPHHGPCELPESEFRIGQNSLANYSDVEVEIREGLDSDADRRLFTQEVTEVNSTFVMNDGLPIVNTTTLLAEEASIDLTFPSGLGAFRSDNGITGYEVELQFEYREAGSADPWVDITPVATGLAPGVNIVGSAVTIKASQRGLTMRGLRFLFPAQPGGEGWDLNAFLTDESADSDAVSGTEMSECVLTRFRSHVASPIIQDLDNVATISLLIRATDQLSGVLDTFSCLVRPLVPTWNAVDEWNTTLINTGLAAWHYANLLRGPAAATKCQDARIDAAGLLNWAQYCEDPAHLYEVSGVIGAEEQRLYWLQQIAGTSRATPSMINGLYGVIVDEPQDAPVQIISERNAKGTEGKFSLQEQPHALEVNFIDSEGNWQVSPAIVYADGYDELTATNIKSVDMWGITDHSLAWRHGRYHLAASRLRRRSLIRELDFENIICNRGDRVDVQSSPGLMALASGRLSFFSRSTELGFGFRPGVEMDPIGVTQYQLQVRKSDGIIQTFDLTYWQMAASRISSTFRADLESIDGVDPAAGDLAVVGTTMVPMIVSAIHHSGHMKARLHLMDYNQGIYTADTEDIPDWDPLITAYVPPSLELPLEPRIITVASDHTVLIFDKSGAVVPRILISFEPASAGTPPDYIQCQYRLVDEIDPDNVQNTWTLIEPIDPKAGQASIMSIEDGALYDVRIRSVTDDGRASKWVHINQHRAIGRSAPPPDPDSLVITANDVCVWDISSEPVDLVGYKVRYQHGDDPDWGRGIPAHGGFISTRQITLSDLSIIPRGVPVTIMVKAVDAIGTESVNPATLLTTLTDNLPDNIFSSVVIEPLWNGARTNCHVDTGVLVADTDTDGFWSGNDPALFWTGDANPFWTQAFLPMTFLTFGTIAGPGTLRMEITAQGAWTLEYQQDGGPILPWPGSVDIPPAGSVIIVRLSIPGGAVQGQVSHLRFTVDTPDLEETVTYVFGGTAGGERVVPTKTFMVIRECIVNFTVLVPAGFGAVACTGVIHDYGIPTPAAGPLIEPIDAVNVMALAGTTYTVTMRGY